MTTAPCVNYSFESYPPLDYFKKRTSKTYFFQKQKNQEESFVDMNRSMAQKRTTPLKVTKKLSFEFKNPYSNPRPFVESLKKNSRQKIVPKSKSTNHIVMNGSDIKINKNKRNVPKSKAQHEIKIYQWRQMTHFPLVKISCSGSQLITQHNSQKQGDIQLELTIQWSEDIKFHLQEIEQFSLLNSLYIVSESLVSFERLYNKFGYFQPTLKMVFITNSHKCKIWANQNIWENYPLPPKFVSKEHQKVEYFYKKVIKMFGKFFKTRTQNHYHFESLKKSVNLVQKLIYELERKNDFIEGMKFINEFISAYSLKIVNHFIYRIEGSDTRSRIFSKLEKSQPNKQEFLEQNRLKQEILKNSQIIQQAEITQKQEESEDEQQKNIKTLKNSYHQGCSKEVLESNVKTIIDKKFGQKQKEIPLKKKSQISICSKQTIVEKKSRFSMYDPKEENQPVNPLNSRHLPNFTNEDFHEEDLTTLYQQINRIDQKVSCENTPPINNEDEYQDKVRNEIERNVRQKNGWLENPQLLFDTDDCAKSYQDSQPSVKIKTRQRNLSKLNRIKSSIAHSIVD